MSSQLESIYSDELFLLAETLGEVKTRTEKLEGEFSTHAKPLEAATNALSAALSGIKALQFHVLDNNLGALSARVEEMRKAVDEQVGVIALELKKADETNAAKAGADAEALRSEIVALQSQLGSLVTQFGQQLERVEFAAKEEAKKLQLIPGPAGAAGASLNPRGTFIDGETYNRLDVVSWLGSSYIATVDGVTEKPSKNSNQWQTLASRGGGGAGGVGDFGSLAGVAQINQGGTGQTTRAAALNALLPDQAGSTQYMLLTDGSGTVSWGAQPVAGLPSQTSNSGRLLTTNGSTASWSNAVTVSGSNATVGGTLTVSGAGTSSFAGNVQIPNATNYVVRNAANTSTAMRMYADSSDYGYVDATGNTELRLQVGSGTKVSIGNTGIVTISGTTASTSTSSGALVVGNGTSGGLGVGGSIYAGANINSAAADGKIQILGTGNTTGVKEINLYRSDGADACTIGLTGSAYAGVFAAGGLGNNEAYIYNTAPLRVFVGTASTNRFDFTSSQFKINPTTASNNTSSGALVVSGGVGVAGNVSSGGQVAATGTGTSGPYIANSAVIDYDSSTARFYGRGPNTSTRPSLGFYSTYSDGAGGLTLMTFNTSGAATISTSLTLSNASQSRAAWGDVGAQLSVSGAVITDTSSSGTVSRAVVNSIAASALAASSTTTYTQAASLFVAGAPTANTNVTITNAYAIYTAGGRINFQGLPTSATGLQAGTLWNDAGTLKVA